MTTLWWKTSGEEINKAILAADWKNYCGASSSSCLSWRKSIFPSSSEREEEEPQRICWSLSLLSISYNILKTLPNPDDSTNGKRPLLSQERIKNKKAKTKHTEASSSSSSSGRGINIDLNELPSSELEELPESSKKSLLRKSKKAKTPRPEAALGVPAINSSPPEWLVEVMRKMEGAVDARLVFVKTLNKTDVNRNQSRLLIPFKQLKRNDFLTLAESRDLEEQVSDNNKKGKKRSELETILVNEKSEPWKVFLKIWNMDKSGNYVLSHGWNKFVSANGLEEGQKISLWSFRCQGALRFALFKTI